MGYETRFKLITETNYPHSEEFYLLALSKINPNEFSSDLKTFKEAFEEPRKWYDYEHDMKELSLQFPDTLFALYAAGEEQGDVWKGFWRAGESQLIKAKLIFTEEPTIYGAKACEIYHPFNLACAIDAYTPHKG